MGFFKKLILPIIIKDVVREITVSDPNDTIFDDIEKALFKRKKSRSNNKDVELVDDNGVVDYD